ncbi:MAG: hypothetical protein V1790_12395 [Planctomycetota bacterium]
MLPVDPAVHPFMLADFYGPFCGWCLNRLPEKKRGGKIKWDAHHPIQNPIREEGAFKEFSFAETWTYPLCDECHRLIDYRASGLTGRLLSALRSAIPGGVERLAIRFHDAGLYAIAAPLKLRLAANAREGGFTDTYLEHLAFALPAIAGTQSPSLLAGLVPRPTGAPVSPRLEINRIGVAYACSGRREAARQLEKATYVTKQHKAMKDEGIKSLFHRRSFVVSRDPKDIRAAHELVQTPYHASTHHTILAVHETGERNEPAAKRHWGLALEQGAKTSILYQAMKWFGDAILDWDKANSDEPVYKNLIMALYVYKICFLVHGGMVAAHEAHPFARTPHYYLRDTRWSGVHPSKLDGWRQEALVSEGRPDPLRDRVHRLLYDLQ